MELAMRYRWFWYVSLPKLQALEAQSAGRFSLLERLSTALELNISHFKASLKYKGKSRPWGLNRRLNRLEARMGPLPEANSAFTLKPKFFQFDGIAGKFIQGGFYSKKPEGQPGEDFYPKGAFVTCGYHDDTGVLLVGNANNMYCSAGDPPVGISYFSQYPLIILHQYGETNGRVTRPCPF
jgi:hypothetical protein